MAAIPFPTSSRPGLVPGESQGRLLNCFAEKNGDVIHWRRVPGLSVFTDTGKSSPRGFLDVGGVLYAAYAGEAITITSGGVVTTLTGTLAGSDPVTIARNNKSPTPDVVCVTSTGVFNLGSVSVTAFADGDLPGSPNDVSFLDGFFLFTYGDGQIWASDLNAVTVNALSFAKAEARADGLLRGVVSGPSFYAMGQSTIEVWRNAATSPFPLARDTVIPVGLGAKWSVAGDCPGWDTGLIFVAADKTVRQLQGYQPKPISTPDLERRISALSNLDVLRGFVSVVGGHPCYHLKCSEWCWVYDVATGEWHERASQDSDTWRAEFSIFFGQQWMVGDTASTNLLILSESVRAEVTDPLTMHIESVPDKGFPTRSVNYQAFFQFAMGQAAESGTEDETDPHVDISWSLNGGATFVANALRRSLGQTGEYASLISVARLGLASYLGIVYRLRVSSSVYSVFLAGYHEPQKAKP